MNPGWSHGDATCTLGPGRPRRERRLRAAPSGDRLQSASATFNSIYLGQFIGVKALAAVSTFPIQFLLNSVFIGISNGSTVLIGQANGAANVERVRAVAGTTVSIAVMLGVVVGIFDSALLGVFVRDAHTLAVAHGLLTGTLRSYVIFGSNTVLFGVMRSSGTVLWPTLISIISIPGR